MWEYKILRATCGNLKILEGDLNLLGKDGWEIIYAFQDDILYVFIMKKEINPDKIDAEESLKRNLNLSEDEMKELK